MAYEKKPGDGVLWTNDRKTADNQPDMTGDLMTLDGKLYRLAAWSKQGNKGVFFSLKLSEITARPTAKPPENEPPPPTNPDDDLPF